MKPLKNILTSLLALSLLASASLYAQALHIEDPYVRAVPPGAPATAAFMGLHNPSNQDLAIIDASSPVAEVVELHTHTDVEGVMQMRRIDKIVIPADGTTELKPGGLHLMLIGLQQPLSLDSQVEVTLTLDDGSLIELSMPVRRVQRPMQGGGQHQHGSHH